MAVVSLINTQKNELLSFPHDKTECDVQFHHLTCKVFKNLSLPKNALNQVSIHTKPSNYLTQVTPLQIAPKEMSYVANNR